MKTLITIFAVSFTLFTLSFPQITGAASEFAAQGVLAGIEVDTYVDSEVASELIATGGERLLEAVSSDLSKRLSCDSIYDIPDSHSLQEITTEYSTDTATAVLIHCLSSIPRIQESQQLYLAELEARRNGDVAQAAYLAANVDEYLVLMVPGWGYQSSADETGADLAKPRAIITGLGFETHLVEVEDNGSVESGADILVAALLQHFRSGKKIILVSASSGGPTVAMALNDPAVANNPLLVGWLNICGVLRGSPVIDTFLTWPNSWLLRAVVFFEGWNYDDLLSLSQSRSTSRYQNFLPPPQLTIVNYIGIPFSGQVSDMGSLFYSILKAQGPNDGLTLITDALAPGYTIMAVGIDHFVNNDPDIDLKTAALLPVLLKLIDGAKDNPGATSVALRLR
ncbi:MAG: hypothetical protein KDI33_20220 [Halioglobus sp.]|nr:hypothetical protein [Halioglobus sp.]